MSNKVIYVTVRLELREGFDPFEVVENMDYMFRLDSADGGVIVDSEITDLEIPEDDD